MDFNYFLRERRPRWQKLAGLLDRVDKTGLHGLNPREADELFSLYRLTSSDLNLVQTRTANSSLVDYLEGIVARAYAQLAVPRQAHFFRAWWMILRNYFPAAIRKEWRAVSLSALTLATGVIFGFAATWTNPRSAQVFLPPEHLQETPRERVAALEQMERDGKTRISTVSENSFLTIYLFNNNIRVGVLGFALGFTFGIGTVIVLFYNGAMLGSLAALYFMDGVGKFFIAWVGPHGSIELPCTVLGCAAGFMVAARQLRRGDTTMMVQIRAIRPTLVDILVGSSSLLVIAGCIEGGFSQINEPTISYWFKIMVAAILFALLVAYLFLIPVKPRPSADSIEDQIDSGALTAKAFAAP